MVAMLDINKPYLLFLGDAPDALAAKTAFGVFDWRREDCVGQLRLPGCVPRLELPELTPAEAVARGARTLVVGVANRGGTVAESWLGSLVDALEQGMDVASGLHTRLTAVDVLRERAVQLGRTLHDVRHPAQTLPIGTGLPRSGHRLLTVGTDASVGKMYTALAIEKALRRRGVSADFRATGQTGILIAGSGISVDAVVADFISGAAEVLAPANDPEHWDLVEGQGSLLHPSFAGVTLGLIHGAQPDVLVLCHEPTRTHMRGLPHQPMPSLEQCLEANLAAARLVSPDVRCAGIAINTKALEPDAALRLLKDTEDNEGLPCVDPVRTGVEAIVDRLL